MLRHTVVSSHTVFCGILLGREGCRRDLLTNPIPWRICYLEYLFCYTEQNRFDVQVRNAKKSAEMCDDFD
jgi:hypothetical protein